MPPKESNTKGSSQNSNLDIFKKVVSRQSEDQKTRKKLCGGTPFSSLGFASLVAHLLPSFVYAVSFVGVIASRVVPKLESLLVQDLSPCSQ
eukprot:4329343-Amphidinium_carterae.1